MAIIIVAIFLFLTVFGSYVVNKIKILRRKEREFYDIYAIIQFFQVIEKEMEWKTFLQMVETITVIRRKTDKQHVIVGEKKKEEEYICYDFCFGTEKYTIYQMIRPIHQKCLQFVLNGLFQCIVDSEKIRMTFRNTLYQNIFIPSYDMALEMLQLLLEQKKKEFQEDYGKLENWFDEVKETIQLAQNKKQDYVEN